jgi:hypothetical protein
VLKFDLLLNIDDGPNLQSKRPYCDVARLHRLGRGRLEPGCGKEKGSKQNYLQAASFGMITVC